MNFSTNDHLMTLFRKGILIRRVEETLLELFDKNKLSGTIHTSIGQEWSAIAPLINSKKDDFVFSNHRCHGHYLAHTDDVEGLIAEIMGKSSGVCGGKGGSQHLYTKSFLSNGILGSTVPIAVGKAMAYKVENRPNICFCFIGDGTLGEGVFYESMNIASNWELPILIIMENNYYAQSTSSKETTAGNIEKRASAFQIEYLKTSIWDSDKLINTCLVADKFVRENCKPLILEIETYRLKAHSKGDDHRDKKEINSFAKKDPLNNYFAKNNNEFQDELYVIDQRIQKAISKCEKDGYSEIRKFQNMENNNTIFTEKQFDRDRINNLIHKAFEENFNKNKRLIFLGEDIKYPYGGAFKVTKDLSKKFPDKVFNTPISESTLIGLGTGLSLGGLLPIVEIMFGDFISLSFDQILNSACKFQFMFNDKVKIPLIIRTPMGGYRGYGPTHSQSLEKFFNGIPYLKIIALNIRVSPKYLYDKIISSLNMPTLIIENKVLYTKFLHSKKITGYDVLISNEDFPTVKISPKDKNPDVTIICYGGMLELAEEAIQRVFFEEEILCEIICPTILQPINILPIKESIEKTSLVLTVEEGSAIGGFTSEWIIRIIEDQSINLKGLKQLCCNHFIPSSSKLEKELLPNVNKIIESIKALRIK